MPDDFHDLPSDHAIEVYRFRRHLRRLLYLQLPFIFVARPILAIAGFLFPLSLALALAEITPAPTGIVAVLASPVLMGTCGVVVFGSWFFLEGQVRPWADRTVAQLRATLIDPEATSSEVASNAIYEAEGRFRATVHGAFRAPLWGMALLLGVVVLVWGLSALA